MESREHRSVWQNGSCKYAHDFQDHTQGGCVPTESDIEEQNSEGLQKLHLERKGEEAEGKVGDSGAGC